MTGILQVIEVIEVRYKEGLRQLVLVHNLGSPRYNLKLVPVHGGQGKTKEPSRLVRSYFNKLPPEYSNSQPSLKLSEAEANPKSHKKKVINHSG